MVRCSFRALEFNQSSNRKFYIQRKVHVKLHHGDNPSTQQTFLKRYYGHHIQIVNSLVIMYISFQDVILGFAQQQYEEFVYSCLITCTKTFSDTSQKNFSHPYHKIKTKRTTAQKNEIFS